MVFTEKNCQDFLFCLSECEQHYLECYINDPCKALQILGTIFTTVTLTWKFSPGKNVLIPNLNAGGTLSVITDIYIVQFPPPPLSLLQYFLIQCF